MSCSIISSAHYSALIFSLLTQQKLHYSFIVKGLSLEEKIREIAMVDILKQLIPYYK